MKSITIFSKKGGFTVNQYETDDNRSDFDSCPHPYGFYHYPDNIKDNTAFNRLKKVMIEDKEKRIEELKTEIQKLKELKYDR